MSALQIRKRALRFQRDSGGAVVGVRSVSNVATVVAETVFSSVNTFSSATFSSLTCGVQ